MVLVSKSEFARTVGVAPSSINKAIKNGRLRVVGEGRKAKINLEDELTREYQKADSEQRRTSGTQKTKKKTINTKAPPPQERERQYIIPDSNVSKHQADTDRIKAQTALTHIKIAEQMKILILREKVDKNFGNMASILLNHFHPLGTRLAPILAGLCGVTDQEIVLKIEKTINKEVFRGLEEFKRVTLEDIK